ncbi:MAG: glycosyltransferase [Bacteroidales bacterium]|nr:glycosyltransferase [Bacteroidales bacterium]
MKTQKKFRVFYFGADMPWQQLVTHGFRRRNTCLLKSLVNNKDVEKVFVVRQVLRNEVFKNIFQKQADTKVRDIYIALMLPERKWLPFTKTINLLFARLFILFQTGRFIQKNDIIWIYWIRAYLFVRKLKVKGRYIFDIDHNIIDDDNLPENERENVSKTLLDIGKRSENILSSCRSMINWYETRGFSNCLYIRNGIDPNRFKKHFSEPDDLKKIPSPRILYVGTLSKWINTNLFLNLIKKRSDWNFIIIGGNYKTSLSEKLNNLPNVSLLGFKTAEVIPRYMSNVDIGLGIYKNEEWLDVDSMKFYEYLASGIPVVSTKYHNYIEPDFYNLIKTSNNPEEIENIIEEYLNLKKQDKEAWRINCKSFIEDSTWDNRIEIVINYLKN